MSRIGDELTEQIGQSGFAEGVPRHVAERARRLLHLLLAAHELKDVTVIGRIARWAERGDYGVLVDGKWFLTFRWDPAVGARDIRLERR